MPGVQTGITNALRQGPGTYPISGYAVTTAIGEDAGVIGDFTLLFRGTVTVQSDGSYIIDGDLRGRDTYDFNNSTHRTLFAEGLTRLERITHPNAVPYTIYMRGSPYTAPFPAKGQGK